MFYEFVLPDLGCFNLSVFDRVYCRLACLGRYELDRNACVHIVELDIILFKPLFYFAECQSDVRIARMLIRLDFLGDARPDEDNNDVITVQMSEICAVSLQR